MLEWSGGRRRESSHPNSMIPVWLINMAPRVRHATVDTHTRQDHVKTPLLHGNRIPWQPVVHIFIYLFIPLRWAGGERRVKEKWKVGGGEAQTFGRKSGERRTSSEDIGGGGSIAALHEYANTCTHISSTVLRRDEEERQGQHCG